MPRNSPPGVTAAQFGRALSAWRAVVGETQVIVSAAGLAPYVEPLIDPFAREQREPFSASAALLPATVDEIRALLRVANQFRIPLWTVSTGRNFAYGGAAPRLAGSVVLDLRRLTRIIDVNEKLGYALVEPGVSYFDLHAHLRENGYRLWVDPPAAGWGSVIGNTLERGFGYTDYGDHAATVCGMEVVLANGDVLRTGMGGVETGTAWQLYQPGYGPSFDAMFMQSNFGIVTKLGVWLMPAPSAYLLGEIQFGREEDLEAIVETLRPLRLDGTIRNHAVIEGGLRRAAGLSSRAQWFEGAGAMPESAVTAMLDELNVGRWNLHFALYGEPEVIDARYAIVRRAFARISQAKFFATRYSGDTRGNPPGNPEASSEATSTAQPGAAPNATPDAPPGAQPSSGGDRNMAGIPSMTAFRMLDWLGGAGAHVDFAPVCPATGRDALRQYTMVKTRAAEYGFDYYGGFTAGTRHLHHIFAAIYNRDDPARIEQASLLLCSLMSDARAAGYGQYRAHLAYMDFAAAQYSFNDGALLRLSETIKDVLDPNGVLSPGKQGIWPAAWRDRRGYT